MRSSGGLATLEEAAAHAAFALLSGPAAGVVGAARIASLAGFANALTFDMGGTSTDVCAITDGEARREHERAVGGFPVRLPTVAVHTVGAGGGSIVWQDSGGALRVGPESAGCRSRARVLRARRTEADGDRREPPARSAPAPAPGQHRARRGRLRGRTRALDPAAVIDVVNAEMVRALRVVSVEQGLDPRDFVLIAFGGAGPLHACALADELGMGTVLVPAAAGVLSALGLVAARRAPRRACARTSCRSPTPASCRRPARPTCATRASRSSSPSRSAPAWPSASTRRTRSATATRIPRALSSSWRSAPQRSGRRLRSSSPASSGRPSGPQVLELEGATAWVPAGWAGETDPYGTLVLRRTT